MSVGLHHLERRSRKIALFVGGTDFEKFIDGE